MSKEYLRITICDNDFTSVPLGDVLYKVFSNYDGYPKEEDFELLIPLIQHLWYSLHNISWVVRCSNHNGITYNESKFDYFKPELSIVDEKDIPINDNGESIFVPLFPNSKPFVV